MSDVAPPQPGPDPGGDHRAEAAPGSPAAIGFNDYAAAAATAAGGVTCLVALVLPTYARDEEAVAGYRMIEDVAALLIVPLVLVLLFAVSRYLRTGRAGGAAAIPTVVLSLSAFGALTDGSLREAYPASGPVQPDPGPGIWVLALGSALVLFGAIAMLLWSRRGQDAR